jgi:hypothetical protein
MTDVDVVLVETSESMGRHLLGTSTTQHASAQNVYNSLKKSLRQGTGYIHLYAIVKNQVVGTIVSTSDGVITDFAFNRKFKLMNLALMDSLKYVHRSLPKIVFSDTKKMQASDNKYGFQFNSSTRKYEFLNKSLLFEGGATAEFVDSL